jgi:hypothetical protein
MRAGSLAARLLILGLLCSGCGRTLTEADCTAVRDRIEAAWLADGYEAATEAQTEQFRRFVKEQGARIADDWMAQCRPRIGQHVDARELDCLRKAARIDDVYACAPK